MLAFLFPTLMRISFIDSEATAEASITSTMSAIPHPVTSQVSNSPNELLSDMSHSAHYGASAASAVSDSAIMQGRIAFWSPTASLYAIPVPAAIITGIGKLNISFEILIVEVTCFVFVM
jgi:hypothetical protein